jgi:hypothetical protein
VGTIVVWASQVIQISKVDRRFGGVDNFVGGIAYPDCVYIIMCT